MKRPHGRINVDYNQNAWGRTLASIYSVRPTPAAAVSMPVTWEEVEEGVEIDDFTIFNARERIAEVGDLWKPVLAKRGRVDLGAFLQPKSPPAKKKAKASAARSRPSNRSA